MSHAALGESVHHGGSDQRLGLVLRAAITFQQPVIGLDHLGRDQALEEALCQGWIDGQKRSRDATTFAQRFTPRRRTSQWSKRNLRIAEELIAEGRMLPAGLAEIDQAKADGRWAAAYSGQAGASVPPDLAAALSANPAAKKMFADLNAANRYAVLYRIETAKRAETRARRIDQFVEMLARGETIHPQPRTRPK